MTRAPARAHLEAWGLSALLFVGLLVRLFFVNDEGFKTDINTYVAWALSLSAHGFASFYSSVGFADYPPGYFYVLAIVGGLWHAFFASHDAGYAILRLLVKLPAILADLGVGLLLYAIARRFAGAAVAIGVAAFYLFNPATIYISASWGQVDSISGGLALLAIYALLRSEDAAPQPRAHLAWIVLAWLSFAYSLLIKPQAAVLLPLLIAFAFVDPQRRRERIIATAIGVAAALAFALLIIEPFHPGNPVAAFGWLWNQYAYGSGVYQYNTVNAFNLWALRGTMWVSDNQYILGLPQYAWGLLLVVAALALIVWRYVQDRTSAALLEGCAIATLAFFVLATRMHERYLFNGLLFIQPAIPACGHQQHAGRQCPEPLGSVDDAPLPACCRHVLRPRLPVLRRCRAASSQAFDGSGACAGAANRRGHSPRPAPLVRSSRGFDRNARSARLCDRCGARRRKLHSVVHRLLVAAR
jgi:Gpi18-like mannosyltransferase